MSTIIEALCTSLGLTSLLAPHLHALVYLPLLILKTFYKIEGRLTAIPTIPAIPATPTTPLPPTLTILYQPDPGRPWVPPLCAVAITLTAMVLLGKMWAGGKVADTPRPLRTVPFDDPPPPLHTEDNSTTSPIPHLEPYTTPPPSPPGSPSLLPTTPAPTTPLPPSASLSRWSSSAEHAPLSPLHGFPPIPFPFPSPFPDADIEDASDTHPVPGSAAGGGDSPLGRDEASQHDILDTVCESVAAGGVDPARLEHPQAGEESAVSDRSVRLARLSDGELAQEEEGVSYMLFFDANLEAEPKAAEAIPRTASMTDPDPSAADEGLPDDRAGDIGYSQGFFVFGLLYALVGRVLGGLKAGEEEPEVAVMLGTELEEEAMAEELVDGRYTEQPVVAAAPVEDEAPMPSEKESAEDAPMGGRVDDTETDEAPTNILNASVIGLSARLRDDSMSEGSLAEVHPTTSDSHLTLPPPTTPTRRQPYPPGINSISPSPLPAPPPRTHVFPASQQSIVPSSSSRTLTRAPRGPTTPTRRQPYPTIDIVASSLPAVCMPTPPPGTRVFPASRRSAVPSSSSRTPKRTAPPPNTPKRRHSYSPRINSISPSPRAIRMPTPPPGTHVSPASQRSRVPSSSSRTPTRARCDPSSPSPSSRTPTRARYDPGDDDTSLDREGILHLCGWYGNLMDEVDDWPTQADLAEDWEHSLRSRENLEDMRARWVEKLRAEEEE